MFLYDNLYIILEENEIKNSEAKVNNGKRYKKLYIRAI